MEGFILQYRAESPQEILKLNTTLLGRVVTITRNGREHFYYYKGLLHDIGFYKLSNGCYFILSLNQHITNLDNLKITKANVRVKRADIINGRMFFSEKFIGKNVSNL